MGVKVRQRVKGKGMPWWVFISHNGQRTSRKVGDKQAAESVASKIRAKLQLGDFSFQGRKKVPTFKEYAETFMKGYSRHNHKESTQEDYRAALDNYLIPVFGNTPFDQIKKKDVKEFLYAKRSGGLAHATVRNLKAYLSCIFSQAEDDEIISNNPVAKTGKLIKNLSKLKTR